jgi:hypothetical protein
MKLIKTIIFTALFLTFSLPVFCQYQNAELDPATANRVIELFEFSLDATFDKNQRAAFVRELAGQWKSDSSAAASYTKLLEIYEQVKKLTADQQRAAQAQFQQTLLAEMQKNPDNPRNKILIDVYKSAHSDFQQQTAEIAPQNFSGNVPPQIVGKWMTGNSSTLTFNNQATGASSNASGIQVMYTILPDGRYEYATLETHTMYSCQTQISLYKTGHIEMNGGQITFVPESGQFTSEDSCNRQYNYTKPAKLMRETYNVSVQRDEYGTKLCLQNSTINGCAYKRD